jgi:hypothetical protein
LGEVLSDCAIPEVGIVDADALPTSEKLSPAAPSTLTAAALVVRFCFEVCLTRDMVASSVSSCENRLASVRSADRRAGVNFATKRETFQSSSIHLHEVQHADGLTGRAVDPMA